jgi:hypothetical protein
MKTTLEHDPPDDNLNTRRRPHGWTTDPDLVETEFWELALGEPEYVQDADEAAWFILNYSLDPHVSVYLHGTSGSD